MAEGEIIGGSITWETVSQGGVIWISGSIKERSSGGKSNNVGSLIGSSNSVKILSPVNSFVSTSGIFSLYLFKSSTNMQLKQVNSGLIKKFNKQKNVLEIRMIY